MMQVDVLAVGAHPDDVELTVGGTLLALGGLGYSTAIVDMTRGEMGTRGTPEARAAEAAEAARILGVADRMCLELGDGRVSLDEESRRRMVEAIRKYRPVIVLAPLEKDLHPDHAWTGRIVAEASFLAGLRRFEAAGEPFRPRTVLRYATHTIAEPSLVVDVSATFDEKRRACLAYKSQFHDPASKEPETYISSRGFWAWWEARARSYGNRIGAEFGEGLVHDGPLPVSDPVKLFRDFGYYP